MIRNFTNALKLIREGKAFVAVHPTSGFRPEAFCYMVDNSLPPEVAYDSAPLFLALTYEDFTRLDEGRGNGYDRALVLRKDGSLRFHFFSDKCSTVSHFQVDVAFHNRPDDPITLPLRC